MYRPKSTEKPQEQVLQREKPVFDTRSKPSQATGPQEQNPRQENIFEDHDRPKATEKQQEQVLEREKPAFDARNKPSQATSPQEQNPRQESIFKGHDRPKSTEKPQEQVLEREKPVFDARTRPRCKKTRAKIKQESLAGVFAESIILQTSKGPMAGQGQ